MAFTIGQITPITGCITQEKFLRGRTLVEMERILGFHPGRLSDGATIAVLLDVPRAEQFDFGGYTQVASHHFDEQYGKIPLDVERAKQNIISSVFTVHGSDRLVKVFPTKRHNSAMDNDEQYPPGSGVPQWTIKYTHPINAIVVAVVEGYPNARYT